MALYGEYKLVSKKTLTIQTHNAVSIAASTIVQQAVSPDTNANGYMFVDGYDKIALTLLNNAATSSSVDILWSNDGTTQHGQETVIAAGAFLTRAGESTVKAKFAKLAVNNADAAAHTISAWAYLKA